MNQIKKSIIVCAILLLTHVAGHAQTLETKDGSAKFEIIANGLEHPWGVAVLPDGKLLITERGGQMSVVSADGNKARVQGLPAIGVGGQGGLLDVVISPDFGSDRLVYFTFSDVENGNAGTALARGRLVQQDAGTYRLDSSSVLFSMPGKSRKGQHFGSRIVISPDGKLLFTIGDRGGQDRAQDFNDHAGAVLRLNRDGSIPEDNPFVGQSGKQDELWSKGHRNPQGAVWDPVTDSLWTVEHGARGGDEINQPERGKNYGWPVISYGRHYSGRKIGRGTEAPGFEQPKHYWDPSIAPSGLAVYQGAMFSEWVGDLLVGALKDQMLVRLVRNERGEIVGEERLLKGKFGRIRDVRVAPDGSIYLLTDNGDDDKIIRVYR